MNLRNKISASAAPLHLLPARRVVFPPPNRKAEIDGVAACIRSNMSSAKPRITQCAQSAGYQLFSFRHDIEGLHAIAILLVVAAHARVPWLAGGFIGVDVFFVLSGYLITRLLAYELTRAGSL